MKRKTARILLGSAAAFLFATCLVLARYAWQLTSQGGFDLYWTVGAIVSAAFGMLCVAFCFAEPLNKEVTHV